MTMKQFYDRVQRNAEHQGFGTVVIKYRNGQFFVLNNIFTYKVEVNNKHNDDWVDFCRVRR